MADNSIISTALSRGYSLDEIADKLAERDGHDVKTIRSRGYDSAQILGKLGYSVPESGPSWGERQKQNFAATTAQGVGAAGEFAQTPLASTIGGLTNVLTSPDRIGSSWVNAVGDATRALTGAKIPKSEPTISNAIGKYAAENVADERADALVNPSIIESAGQQMSKFGRDVSSARNVVQAGTESERLRREADKAEGALGIGKFLYNNPSYIPEFVIEQAPNTLAGIIPGLGTASLYRNAAMKAATPELAKATMDRGVKAATAVGMGTEAAQTAMVAADSIRQTIEKADEKYLLRNPRYNALVSEYGDAAKARAVFAEELINTHAPAAGAGTLLGSLVTGGGAAQGRALMGQVPTIKQLAKDVNKQGMEEAVQSPLEDAAQYSAEIQGNPEAKLDPGKSSALGYVAGVGMAGPTETYGHLRSRLSDRRTDTPNPAPAIDPANEAALDPQAAVQAQDALQQAMQAPSLEERNAVEIERQMAAWDEQQRIAERPFRERSTFDLFTGLGSLDMQNLLNGVLNAEQTRALNAVGYELQARAAELEKLDTPEARAEMLNLRAMQETAKRLGAKVEQQGPTNVTQAAQTKQSQPEETPQAFPERTGSGLTVEPATPNPTAQIITPQEATLAEQHIQNQRTGKLSSAEQAQAYAKMMRQPATIATAPQSRQVTPIDSQIVRQQADANVAAREAEAAQNEIGQSGGLLRSEKRGANPMPQPKEGLTGIKKWFGEDAVERDGALTPIKGERIGVVGRTAIRTLLRPFGTKVKFYHNPKKLTADGAYHKEGDTIYINTASDISYPEVAFHENTHRMRQAMPKAWAAMKDAYLATLPDQDAGLRAMAQNYWGATPEGKARLQALAGVKNLFAKATPAQRTQFDLAEHHTSVGDMILEEGVSDLGGKHATTKEFWQATFDRLADKYAPAKAREAVKALSKATIELIDGLLKIAKYSGQRGYQTISEEQLKATRAAVADANAQWLAENMKSNKPLPDVTAPVPQATPRTTPEEITDLEGQDFPDVLETKPRGDPKLTKAQQKAIAEHEATRIAEGRTVEQSAPLDAEQWSEVRRIALAKLKPAQRKRALDAEREYLRLTEEADALAEQYKRRAGNVLKGVKENGSSSVAIMDGSEPVTLAGSGKLVRGTAKVLTIDIGRYFLGKQKKLDISTPEGQKAAAIALAREAAYALTQDGHAVGWYDRKVREALTVSAMIHPELLTDKNAQVVFKMIAAITSNGQAVRDNFILANIAYTSFKSGTPLADVLGEGGGARRGAMRKALIKLDNMIKDHGAARVGELLIQPMTVSQIAKEFGLKVSGEHVTTVLPAAVGLGGPKIGSFYANLSGHFDSLTIDMWFMRTAGRITGSIVSMPETVSANLNELLGILPESGEWNGKPVATLRAEIEAFNELSDEKMGDVETVMKTVPNVILYARAQLQKFSAPDASGKTFTQKTLQNENARRLVSALDSTNDSPGNGAERNNLREIVALAQNTLAKFGIELTTADLQAVLWYYEKNLYTKLGANNASAKPWDYASAARFGIGRALGLVDVKSSKRAGQVGSGERPESGGVQGEVQRLGQEAGEVRLSAYRGVNIEVAPDPRDKAAKQAFESLSEQSKKDVTYAVAQKVLPKLLSDMGIAGRIEYTIGGFLGSTSPSIIVRFDQSVSYDQVSEFAVASGALLRQQAAISYDETDQKTGNQTYFVKVAPSRQLDYDEQRNLFQHIYSAYPDAKGFTGRDGALVFGNFPDFENGGAKPDDAAFLREIKNAVQSYGADYTATISAKAFRSDWHERDDGQPLNFEGTRYENNVSNTRQQGTVLRGQGFIDALQSESDQLVRDEIAKRTSFSTTRSNAAGSEQLRASTRRSDGSQAIDEVEGIHYSKEPRTSLSGSFFGTGLRGAELDRIKNAADERLRHRIYFYVNSGKGINPEFGVGPHAHKATLNNLYDLDNDPRDLGLSSDKNLVESRILDAGYDGFVSHSYGAAVLIGPRTIEVEQLGMTKPEADLVMKADKSPYGKLRAAVVSNKSLPGGQMLGSDWKKLMPKLMPEVDVSHLADEQKYYKGETVRKPDDVKFSPFRSVDTSSPSFLKWFGDSKVVDADGKPLRVYHGTGADITEFEKPSAGKKTSHYLDFGFHFGTTEVADRYATIAQYGGRLQSDMSRDGKKGDPAIYPVYLSAQNIADITSGNPLPKDVKGAFLALAEDNGMSSRSKYVQLIDVDPINFLAVLQRKAGRKAIKSVFESAGYDGIKYSFYGDSYVVFNPTQIKSAVSNTGEFSDANPDIRYSAPRFKPLDAEEQAVAQRFFDRIDRQAETLISMYLNRNGTLIDPDLVKELSPDYKANPEKWTNAVHEPSSKLSKMIYARLLTNVGPEHRVIFTAGGGGSGKSESLAGFLRNAEDADNIVFDSTLSSFDSAKKKIDAALEKGAQVTILYTNRPADAAFDFSLNRKRAVPIAVIASAHAGAQETLHQLAEHYGDRVTFEVRNNYGERVDEMFVGSLPDVPQESYDDLERRFYEIARRRLEEGTISADRFEAVVGRAEREDGAEGQGGLGENQDQDLEPDRQGDLGQGELRRSTRRLSDDLEQQYQFLTQAANDAGYKNIDDWAANDIGGYIKAAAEWREQNPSEVLYSRNRFVATGDGQYIPGLKNALQMLQSGDEATRRKGGQYTFKVMNMPTVLRQITNASGAKVFKKISQELFASGSSIASKATDTHGVSKHGSAVDNSVVAKLPKLLADPVAVFSSAGGMNEKSFRVILSGNLAVVAIDPQERYGFVTTIHPFEPPVVQRWIDNGLLRYINEEATARVAPVASGITPSGGNLPAGTTTVGSASDSKPRVAPTVDWSLAKQNAEVKKATVVTKADIEALPEIALSEPRLIGDSGRQYTPEQEAMNRNVGRITDGKTAIERIKDYLAKRWQQGLFDQFHPFKGIDKDAYALMRLAKGSTGAFEAFLKHGKLKIVDGVYDADAGAGVLQDVFIPLGREVTDFLYWIAGNRAERLAAEGKERLFSVADIKAAKALSDGVTGFDYTLANGQVTRDRTLIYKDALSKFNAFNKNVLDMAEQSGLIDGASRKLWEHEFYVPFYRVMEDENLRAMGIKKGLVRQEAFKQLKGGDKPLGDLLGNTLLNWHHLIDASAKNRAAKAAVEAAERMGLARKALPGETKTVWFSDGGRKAEYKIDDLSVLEAVNGLQYVGLRGPLWSILTAPKHWLTVGVTASPFFKVRNLIRDSMQAIATSELSYNLPANLWNGYQLTNRERQEYISALAGGGLIRFGTMVEGNEAARTRQLIKQGSKDALLLDGEGAVRKFWDKFGEPALMWYNELGNRGEEINRMALYQQMIDRGATKAEAALAARDLMDFSLQGGFETVRILSQVVPFFNARLQGMYKLGRATKTDREHMAAVTFIAATAGLAMMAFAAGDDERWKRWKQLDEHVKAGYWVFFIGDMEFRIPRPFELGAVAHAAERTVEALFDKERDAGKRLAEALLSSAKNQLSMNPVPQAVKPIVDLYANKNSFTGRPIETMGMERLDPQHRFTSSTSMPARWASNATGGMLSPVQYDHLVQGYFGWLGAMSVAAADETARAVNNEPKRPQKDYWKVVTGGLVQDDPVGTRYMTVVYEQAKELEQAYATFNKLRKEGKTEEAKAYREDNADKLKTYRQVENVKSQLSRLNERIRMIERSNLHPAEKRVKIRELKQRESDLAERLSQ